MGDKLSTAMISKDFFPDGIKIDEKEIFPMAVIATMSSGKSTLINALIGKEILPNSNMACTAMSYSILDDDHKSKEIICITDKRGKIRVVEENLAEELAKINDSVDTASVFIRSHINGVLNTDKALLIIDTPGPNNARNASHENILFKTLEKINRGLFLYVLNVSQIAIKDDKYLLHSLRAIIDKKPDIKIIFALNKMDVIDEEHESVEAFMKYVQEYIDGCGFINADIIPVSAMAAILFKKVLSREKLTRKEYVEFRNLYDLYAPKDFNMKKYAITCELKNQFTEIDLYGEKIKVGDLNQAIENTGIGILEDYIQKAQILSSERIKNTVKVRIK